MSTNGLFRRNALLQEHKFGLALNGTLRAELFSNLRCPMRRTERVREVVSGPLESTDLQQRTAGGWKLVAIEWEREVETADDQLLAEVPFGLRIAPETCGWNRIPQNGRFYCS
jgi:hypothetical protein